MIRSDGTPGPSPLELLRSLPAIRRDPLAYLLDCAQRYGDLVRFQAGPVTAFFANHPDAVKHVLQDNHHNYSKDTIQYNSLATITGKGLLTSDEPAWLAQRRLIQPAFARPRLAVLGQLVAEASQPVLARWQAVAAANQEIDVDSEMMRLALEVVGKALFSIDLSRDAARLTAAVLAALDHIMGRARNPFSWPDRVPTPENLRFRAALRVLDEAVYTLIAARRRTPDAHADDLLGMLLLARDAETGAAFSDQQVRDEVITMLIAGHETVASALTWSWYLLARHPQVRPRLRSEVSRVLGGRPPAFDDLPGLAYTRQVFDESLRLYPPAWLITRQARQADTLNGCAIPAGALLIFSPYALHRRADTWAQPEEFDPDRFSVNGQNKAPRYAYIPFGGGPRLCIGNAFAQVEAALVLATFVQAFDLDLLPGQKVSADALVTIRPQGGLAMRVRRVGGSI
jgi:cytochrome P450